MLLIDVTWARQDLGNIGRTVKKTVNTPRCSTTKNYYMTAKSAKPRALVQREGRVWFRTPAGEQGFLVEPGIFIHEVELQFLILWIFLVVVHRKSSQLGDNRRWYCLTVNEFTLSPRLQGTTLTTWHLVKNQIQPDRLGGSDDPLRQESLCHPNVYKI